MSLSSTPSTSSPSSSRSQGGLWPNLLATVITSIRGSQTQTAYRGTESKHRCGVEMAQNGFSSTKPTRVPLKRTPETGPSCNSLGMAPLLRLAFHPLVPSITIPKEFAQWTALTFCKVRRLRDSLTLFSSSSTPGSALHQPARFDMIPGPSGAASERG